MDCFMLGFIPIAHSFDKYDRDCGHNREQETLPVHRGSQSNSEAEKQTISTKEWQQSLKVQAHCGVGITGWLSDTALGWPRWGLT